MEQLINNFNNEVLSKVDEAIFQLEHNDSSVLNNPIHTELIKITYNKN